MIGYGKKNRDVTEESVLKMALVWERAKGSNHRVSTEGGEEEGANKQQSRRKSDKDGIDSRKTGRVECDEEENDVRDKAE